MPRVMKTVGIGERVHIDAYLRRIGADVDKCREPILRKLTAMLPMYRRTYLRAVTGDARYLAIKAYCCECAGWVSREIKACKEAACPLWPYRPYRRPAQPAPRAKTRVTVLYVVVAPPR